MKLQTKLLMLLGASTALGHVPTAAWAASGTAKVTDARLEEIIVTARKRPETLISAPVAITAFGKAELERRGITRMDEIAHSTPLLMMGEGGGTTQGGAISLRGISGPESQPLGDQAISFNIDGVAMARATVRRLSQMDMETVEILKGPQSLFFGKNSPGGVISVRTADPGDHFDSKIELGYEGISRQYTAEGYISGPVSDTVGLRLAFYASDITKGWIKNNAVADKDVGPAFDTGPKDKEYAARFTAKFTPSERFDAKLKATYNVLDGDSTNILSQLASCPLGAPQKATTRMDCKADHNTSLVGPGPRIQALEAAALGGRFASGKLFAWRAQALGSWEMNYHLTDSLLLTSISSIFDYRGQSLSHSSCFCDIAVNLVHSGENLKFRDLNQEVRLMSSFKSPLNFVVGALYQDSDNFYSKRVFTNGITPTITVGSPANPHQTGNTYSALAQIIYRPVATIEFDAGGRWTQETKSLSAHINQVPVAVLRPHQKVRDFSPEVTLAWRPDEDHNVFASYKEGFLSGGYNAGSPDFTKTSDYAPEFISGYEGGVKARLFNRAVRVNVAVYSYKIVDLQVQTNVLTSPTTVASLITNAGLAHTKGVDIDGVWYTGVPGLTVNAALSYDQARYDRFVTQCWRGQSQQLGCNLNLNASGVAQNQSLAGFQIVRSPDWGGNLGVTYERPVGGSGWKIGLSGDTTYSSAFWADSNAQPNGRYPAYFMYNAEIRFINEPRGLEIALIGKNLSDELVYMRALAPSGSGATPGTTVTGAMGDEGVLTERGRELWLRVTWHPYR